MPDTSEQIIDTAEALIQRGGFHAFSFQDIADRIGIKKASIYYHHPAKAALGREVIARYRRRFIEIMAAVDEDKSISYWQALDLYLEPIVRIARADDKACLCGILGGEFGALPEEMQVEVGGFFDEHLTWLTSLFQRGRKAGEFNFTGPPTQLARLVLSAIEGALLIHRAIDDPKHFNGVMAYLKTLLRG
ncbi:MAG: TetR/AcrR family transcriptional regulator [Proteobacteria bacterium]|nr:TetR/AcrR family transcriptional regulator [Pseudomonadota bacterium]